MRTNNKSTLSKITESRNFGLVLGLIVLLIVAAIITPSMYSLNSILNMLQNNAVYGLLAIGEMMVIITAGIDISIGATLSLTGVICCRLMAENPGVPGIVWLLLSLVIGALCGAFNGLLVGYFKMVPMIATLGTMYIFFLIQRRRMVVPASVYRGVYGICDKEDPRDPIDLMDSDHCIHIGDPVPRIYIERTTDLRDRYQSGVRAGCRYQTAKSCISGDDPLRNARRSVRNALYSELCDLQLYDRRRI